MVEQGLWFERKFVLGLSHALVPELLGRLAGTPGRLEERVSRLPIETLRRRDGDRWSIQEHAGHLADLEPLWIGRVQDLAAELETLREADLENTATWDADHNVRAIETVLKEFRVQRAELLRVVEELGPAGRQVTALHPRLRQPMTVADLCFFVAEHDDHHLTTISAMAVSASS